MALQEKTKKSNPEKDFLAIDINSIKPSTIAKINFDPESRRIERLSKIQRILQNMKDKDYSKNFDEELVNPKIVVEEELPQPEDIMGTENLVKFEEYLAKLTESEAKDTKTEQLDEKPIKKFRNRPLTDTKTVYQENAWDDVEWDEDQKNAAALKVEYNSQIILEEVERLSLEERAAQNWDNFYGIHQNKFFKNRTWLFTEFPEFIGPYDMKMIDPIQAKLEIEQKRSNENFPGENSGFRILEVGCGNGSTVFPLLNSNKHPETYVYCCDFSKNAVQVVTQSEHLDRSRCTPFVWDITQNSERPFPDGSIDVISIIFVLSAISPEKFNQAIGNLWKVLKPGGTLLFRDYGLHDLVQLRIKPGHCISQNFYFRGDGTRVYFFTQGS